MHGPHVSVDAATLGVVGVVVALAVALGVIMGASLAGTRSAHRARRRGGQLAGGAPVVAAPAPAVAAPLVAGVVYQRSVPGPLRVGPAGGRSDARTVLRLVHGPGGPAYAPVRTGARVDSPTVRTCPGATG